MLGSRWHRNFQVLPNNRLPNYGILVSNKPLLLFRFASWIWKGFLLLSMVHSVATLNMRFSNASNVEIACGKHSDRPRQRNLMLIEPIRETFHWAKLLSFSVILFHHQAPTIEYLLLAYGSFWIHFHLMWRVSVWLSYSVEWKKNINSINWYVKYK